jgi:dTMP kinase
MFFAFDGLDGTGKSTQMDLFVSWLLESGHNVVRCIDPGTTPVGQRIRELLLGDEVPIGRMSEMLLFMAARAQLVESVIKPALDAGRTVVSDRYLLANLVYQGYAGGLNVDAIREIGRVATQGIMPDIMFVLDMSPQLAAERMQRERDRMEDQDATYIERLRAGFLTEAASDPRIVVIDAARDIESVQADIRAAASRVLGTRIR